MQRRFLNHPVSTGVGWPNAEAKFNFGGWGIIAFPPSPELEASLHIDLAAHQLSLADGMSVLNQLLSIAAWLDDNYVVLLPGLSGSSEPNRQPRQTREFPTSMVAGWSNSWEPMMDGRARLTLAIYREAVNMQSYHFLPFAVVGFYRVLEVAWPDGKERSSRIEERLHEVLSGDDMWGWLLRNSGYSRGLIPSEVGRYLREQCRHAAAHARGGLVINPDDGAHQYKMGAAALLLRKLARQAMQGDIGLGVNRWDQNDHSSPAPPLSASSTAKL